jgi:hypothetical protein
MARDEIEKLNTSALMILTLLQFTRSSVRC